MDEDRHGDPTASEVDEETGRNLTQRRLDEGEQSPAAPAAGAPRHRETQDDPEAQEEEEAWDTL